MKIYHDRLSIKTKGFCHVVNITDNVLALLKKSGIHEGLLCVFVVGSTAALTTVEYEPGLVKDLEEIFEKLVPQNGRYHHEETWHDGNGFSHVRASLLKPSITIPVVESGLTLGTWQQIVLLDFDNHPRTRSVAVQIMGK
ncbi:MAG: secondary thiamine-phosphate synthase enzyme YjbQ [Chlamydiota bacterium]|nr:secondary thiamine-phosphate synthase enzyme YjbQ [Chlamydiota bacterium]